MEADIIKMIMIVLFAILAITMPLVLISLIIKKYKARKFHNSLLNKKKATETKPHQTIKQNEIIQNSIEDKFVFPNCNYQSEFIKIKDKTNYKEEVNWFDLTAKEKSEYSLKDFKNDFRYGEYDITSFQDYLIKKNSKEKFFRIIKNSDESLETIIENATDFDADPFDNDYIFDIKESKILLESNFFEEFKTETEIEEEINKQYNKADLIDICSGFSPKKTLSKNELIKFAKENNIEIPLAPHLKTNNNFVKFLHDNAKNYLDEISDLIKNEYPIIKNAIWDDVSGNFDFDFVEDIYKKYRK